MWPWPTAFKWDLFREFAFLLGIAKLHFSIDFVCLEVVTAQSALSDILSIIVVQSRISSVNPACLPEGDRKPVLVSPGEDVEVWCSERRTGPGPTVDTWCPTGTTWLLVLTPSDSRESVRSGIITVCRDHKFLFINIDKIVPRTYCPQGLKLREIFTYFKLFGKVPLNCLLKTID